MVVVSDHTITSAATAVNLWAWTLRSVLLLQFSSHGLACTVLRTSATFYIMQREFDVVPGDLSAALHSRASEVLTAQLTRSSGH